MGTGRIALPHAGARKTSKNPFYHQFQASREQTEGRRVYDIGNGQWNIPSLHTLLEEVLADNELARGYELEHHFEGLGHRFLLLNAQRVDSVQSILLGIHDITERHQTAGALSASEQRYRSLFESIDQGFCVIEVLFDDERPVDYRFVEVNPAFETHTGIKDIVGRRMREIAPQHEELWFETYGQVAQAGEPVRFQHRAEALGRSYDVFAFRVGEPEQRRVAVLFNDITEHLAGEEALKQSEERLRLAAEATGFGSYDFDVASGTAVWSEQLFAITGYAGTGPVPRQALLKLVHPDDRDRLARVVDQALDPAGPGRHELEYRIVRPDGRLRWARDVGQTFIAGESEHRRAVRIVGTLQDITEQRHAELQVREHERRFRTLVEQIQDYAIFMIDTDGRCTSWNEGVRRVLGFEEHEFLGQDVAAAIFTPEDIAAGVPQAELRTAAETGSACDDRWMKCKNGTRFWADGMTSALRDEEGTLLGFMKVMRDHTERKHLEDELRQLAAELAEGARRKDEFLATLAHELRNPLAPLCSGLQLMRLSEDKSATFAEVGPTMERQIEQLVTLVDDLLDISRITRGRLELRKFQVTLSSVIELAIETSRPLLDDAGHELTVALPDEPIELYADPHRLAQVLSNLLNNAAKYTPDGGQVWLTVQRQDSELVFSVKDNGIGIPADRLEDIFEMFNQVEGSGEQLSSGLGIGLTLVKSLLEMHGGRISARSDGPGRGSEFFIWLPLATESTPDPPKPANKHESPEPGPTLRVLVVDDKEDAAKLLGRLIEMQGHQIRTAGDGEQAIEVAAEFRPDLILMDIGMPRMDGYEAARQIRERAWGQGVKLVALSGWGQDEDKRKSQEAGFDEHLTKPPAPDDLQRLLAGKKPAERPRMSDAKPQ